MTQRILISGASIAGLTLAYWLARYGFQTTVVERASGLRSGGNGVDVRGHAVDVVDRMGIKHQVQLAAADVQGMKFVDAEDYPIARIDAQDPNGTEIMRGDLVRLLHEAAGPEVEYIFGDSIRSLDQDADGVTVSFDHAETRRFDLVVGADGMHSTVRRLAFGPESQFIRHKDHYFAFANARAELGEDRWVTMYNRPGKMAGIYRSGNHAQAKAYFVFRSPEIAFNHRDVDHHKRLLHDAFSGDTSWHIPDLLTGAVADPDFYFDALSQVHMNSWSTGRVTLTGDAAWCASPASGAGAELALIGAYRLAGELARTPDNYSLALTRYHEAHHARVRASHRIGVNVSLMVPKTTTGSHVRNTLARLPLMRTIEALGRLAPTRQRAALVSYETLDSTPTI